MEIQTTPKLETASHMSTTITSENLSILFTKSAWDEIIGQASKILSKKLTTEQNDNLFKFICRMPADHYYGMTYDQAVNAIASRFVQRYC